MIELLNKEQEDKLSLINDPFKTSCVNGLIMCMSTRLDGGFYWWGKVTFNNGKTKGEQQTGNHDSFEELYLEVKQILESVTK